MGWEQGNDTCKRCALTSEIMTLCPICGFLAHCIEKTGLEKSGKSKFFSRSGNIAKSDRENLSFVKVSETSRNFG